MAIHLIKLSVGPESLAQLEAWQAARLKQSGELVHVTRQTPTRAAELLNGGSIYWVVKGFVVAHQRLLELRPLLRDGVPHCGLVHAAEMVRVVPRPHRPFQGWRYLPAADAPRDLAPGDIDADMPEALRRELGKLGLI